MDIKLVHSPNLYKDDGKFMKKALSRVKLHENTLAYRADGLVYVSIMVTVVYKSSNICYSNS